MLQDIKKGLSQLQESVDDQALEVFYVKKQLFHQNRPKSEYMTPELGKVSESRRQTGGVRSVAEGTVSQIHYLMKNKDGKTYALKLARIDEVLYDEKTRGDRKIFQQKREEFLKDKKSFESAYLATFNNKLDESRDTEQQQVEAAEYERIDRIWGFERYKEELPMCIISTGYNNNAKFRI